jgi:hypothetical protein
MKKIVLVIGLILVASNALCIDDSPSNRRIEAERYLEATPPQALFEDMAEQMAYNLAPSERKNFKDLIMKHLDLEALTAAFKKALVDNFTAEELGALADFYGTEVGKSAMKKFGTYMADVMPSIDTEMAKVYTKVSRELEGPSQ